MTMQESTRDTRPYSVASAMGRSIPGPIDMAWAWWLLVSLLLGLPLLTTKADPDLWGHLRFGLDILDTASLPSIDPYSFTQDRPWVNHEWLSELTMGIAYSTGGVVGLVLWKTLVVGCGFFLIATGLKALHPLAAAALLALAVAASPSITGTIRPQIWTFLFLIILVRLLRARLFRWCPVLLAVWVNFHGGWIVGLGVLGTWMVVAAAEQWYRTRHLPWLLLLVPAVSALATILNPYRWGMWRFLYETLEPSRDISEWRPLLESAATPWVALTLVITVVAAVVISPRLRPEWPWLAVLALLSVATLRVSRIEPLAAPVALLIVGPALARWWPAPGRLWRAPTVTAAALTVIPLGMVAASVAALAVPAVRCVPIEGEWRPDVASGQVIAASAAPGRLVTLFGWGQYAIWHFGPRVRVSWDGRRETVYSPEVARLHTGIYSGGEEGDVWLEHLRPEYVWLSNEEGRRRDWLVKHGYRLDVQTSRAYVAVRDDLPLLAPVQRRRPSCFP